MNSAKLKAWLCLKNTPELNLKSTLELLKRFPDPQSFVGNPAHEVYNDQSLSRASADYLSQAKLPDYSNRTLELCESHHISFLCITDADYPTSLRGILVPPLVLYYRGDLLAALRNVCLAVVGTRKPSTYGMEMCRRILAPVCARGTTIISGLAMGIDTIAHHAALQAKSKTVAVLAHGLDSIYPPANKSLSEKIEANGALISDYEPGTKLERWNFPARNRIISALAQAVFVVEAPLDSGALLTARFGTEQSRSIFALPGNVNHLNAQGPNQLIKDGAKIITCPEDVLDLLGYSPEINDQLEFLPDLSPEEQQIYDILGAENREISFDEFLILTGFSFGKLSIVLLNLELKGMVAKSSGNSFLRL
ncbi:MAG: DNA-protecting protein DprA [Candidatus Cloacimonetes bacterium HGW-Cloacimonetes-3]|jgi:DNA processing protein|nr:MAG: DNA-protecting protein DprA [Candidatus Cloacimonetes bacterium HGW-Cloacimonetes-3]